MEADKARRLPIHHDSRDGRAEVNKALVTFEDKHHHRIVFVGIRKF